MKINVVIHGCIDVPDNWGSDVCDIAEYRYNDQLEVDDAIDELAKKLKKYPDDIEVVAEINYCQLKYENE